MVLTISSGGTVVTQNWPVNFAAWSVVEKIYTWQIPITAAAGTYTVTVQLIDRTGRS